MTVKLLCATMAVVFLPMTASAQNPCDFPYPDSCQFPDTCCAVSWDDCPWELGDINGLDVTYMVNFLRGFGPLPPFFSIFDYNCNCRVNGVDIIYLINYLSGRGPAPICCFYLCQIHPRNGVVGDRVWYDADSNGIQDVGEIGLSSVVVNLTDCDNPPNILVTDTTHSDGYYRFDSLATNTYKVRFELPDNHLFSPRNQGNNDTLDSDAFTATGFTSCFNLSGDEVNMTVDAGMYLAHQGNGCTRPPAYWKNHAGSGIQPDSISHLLPLWLGVPDSAGSIHVTTADIASDILRLHVYGHPNNGISWLYAQLLVAKLNISNGASDDDIAAIIDTVDTYLSVHNWQDWDELNHELRQMIHSWRVTLNSYNTGVIGPGLCDDESK